MFFWKIIKLSIKKKCKIIFCITDTSEQKSFQIQTLTQTHFYTQHICTQISWHGTYLDPNPLKQQKQWTQKVVHTNIFKNNHKTFPHTNLSTQKNSQTSAFYTQTWLHKCALTHNKLFAHDDVYRQKVLFADWYIFTHLFLTINHLFMRKGCFRKRRFLLCQFSWPTLISCKRVASGQV